jgi:hypothetical protein
MDLEPLFLSSPKFVKTIAWHFLGNLALEILYLTGKIFSFQKGLYSCLENQSDTQKGHLIFC